MERAISSHAMSFSYPELRLNNNLINNKSALIVGCNGTFGSAIGKELVKQGWHVHGLVRHINKKPDWLAEKNTFVGNCFTYGDVAKAANNCQVIVYAANPLYHQWHTLAEAMLEASVLVAEKYALHLLFPGNVYSFDPLKTPVIDETSDAQPVTEKGNIRLRMEKRLQRACANGATVSLIRAGDFIQKGADSSWINYILKAKNSAWKMSYPAEKTHKHCYVFMPDFVHNAIELLAIEQSGFNVWHDAGITIDYYDWLDALNMQPLPVVEKAFPWWLLYVMSWLHPVVGEVIKMRYLWQQDLRLNGDKLKQALGEQYQVSTLHDIVQSLKN